MRYNVLKVLVPVLVLGACSRSDKSADAALQSDLSLAQQQQQYRPLDTLGAAEQLGTAPVATAPVRTGTSGSTAVRRTTSTSTRRRSSSGSTSSGTTRTSSGGDVGVTTTTHTEVVKHTKRDAAIGAVVGGVAGQVIGHDTKSTVIGAAAGGILGAVIGNNVDKKKKTTTTTSPTP